MKAFVIVTIVAAVLLLLICSGGYFFAEIPFFLLFGWIWYLRRVLPEIEVNYSALAMGVIALGLFLIGTHIFARKLAAEFTPNELPSLKGDDRTQGWAFRSTLALVTLTIVAFTAGISFVGIVHQCVWLGRSDAILQSGMSAIANRMNSQSNLKQIGIGLHNYSFGAEYNSLPPGAIFSEDGRAIHGWATVLRPYLENPHRIEIDMNRPWDDPANAEALKQSQSCYLQPGVELTHDEDGNALIHYSTNANVMGGDRPMKVSEITDGLSNTIQGGEIADGYPAWGYPINWRDPALGINRSGKSFGSSLRGGVNFLFVDGSARYINEDVDPRVLKALSTPAGGEEIPEGK